MRSKFRLSIWLLLLAVIGTTISAQDSESEEGRIPGAVYVDTRPKSRAQDCETFAFAQGCLGFNLGPVLSSDGKGLVYGAAAGLTYFMIDRLGLGLNGGAIFGSGYQDYSVGPGLTYYLGPFAGYLITPSFGVTRHYLRGNLNAEGWAYGPSIGLMSNLFGRVFWGISVGYYTYQVEGYKSSDWSWSPVVYMPF
jgi:hypothetical protein